MRSMTQHGLVQPGLLIGAWAALAWMLLSAPGLRAQDDSRSGHPVVIGQCHAVTSNILGEERPVFVHTPPDYAASSARYPVLYLLDAGEDTEAGRTFHVASALVRFLAASSRIPEMIVVGIPNLPATRTRDLTPPETSTSVPTKEPTAGGAGDFRRFLTEELRPWVDSRYRTERYALLVGHSFGGLFITSVLLEDPAAFDGYIASSPSLHWDDQRFVEQTRNLFSDHPATRASLYLSMANERRDMLAGAWTLTRNLELLAPSSFRWTWRVYPDQTHRSVLLESLGDGLEWTFDGWHPVQEFVRLAQREIDLGHQVERHFAELSARLGYAVAISERLLIDVGIAFFEARQSDLAIRAFESNRDLFPDSPVVHRFVAIGYEEACRRAEAAVSYDTARELAAAHGRPEEARRYGQLADHLRALIASGEPCV